MNKSSPLWTRLVVELVRKRWIVASNVVEVAIVARLRIYWSKGENLNMRGEEIVLF
jgi:hypothetical protein